MHLFIEEGNAWGISIVSRRYARANNPLVEGYNTSKPTTYLQYLDANNLYGWATSQALPTGGFQWIDDTTVLEQQIVTGQGPPEDAVGEDKSYILEVDLEYPQHLHNKLA